MAGRTLRGPGRLGDFDPRSPGFCLVEPPGLNTDMPWPVAYSLPASLAHTLQRGQSYLRPDRSGWRCLCHAGDGKPARQGRSMTVRETICVTRIHSDRRRKPARSRISGVRLRRRLMILRRMSAAYRW
jgi:hypothetical protein